jgi:hypothetical protein
MPNADSEDKKYLVTDIADDAIIPNPVSPEP